MKKTYDSRRERRKLIVYLILMVCFAVATLVGGIMVIQLHKNAAYSLFPALFTVVFSLLCKRTRKIIQKNEE